MHLEKPWEACFRVYHGSGKFGWSLLISETATQNALPVHGQTPSCRRLKAFDGRVYAVVETARFRADCLQRIAARILARRQVMGQDGAIMGNLPLMGRGSCVLLLSAVLAAFGCGSSDAPTKANAGGNGSTAGGPGSGSGGSSTIPGGGAMTITVPGEVDPNAPEGSELPPLPGLVNVEASAVGDSVSLSFDPIDGAVDYRVYELPANEDISSTADGHLTVKNALYRCAGNRQAPALTVDGATQVQSGAVKSLVDGQDVWGYKRSLEEATLGYVYATAGDGRVPVYALGDGSPKADNDCYFQRWNTTRLKVYVTSSEERTKLLKAGYRDDGIAFYAPAEASADTRQIYTSRELDGGLQFYFADGPEAQARKSKDPAFLVRTAASDDSIPLLRAFYANVCGASHDELAAGKPRFERARRQGDQLPMFDLHWSGLTGTTTLVVEALAEGCPYQGLLGPIDSPAYIGMPFKIAYEAWQTPATVKAASPTNEVFINGQFDASSRPRPIARSFVKIAPAPAPALDWAYGFKADDAIGELTEKPCGTLSGNCFGQHRQGNARFDLAFINPEDTRWGQASLMGELWVMYADLAADTNGKFRLTPLDAKADMTADKFVYATMDVDSLTTRRRYPQILISDQDVPVQENLPLGNTLIIQTFGDWPLSYQLEVCDHRIWDVNDQCPSFDFYHQLDPADPGKVIGLAPNAEVGEHVGLDRSTHFEVYASTKRVYLFLDGEPYGCAILPSAGVPSGPVTVTFGDVLYHSDADSLFDFSTRKLKYDSPRHFDNLGFKSHVAAPAWDESRYPCTSRLNN